MTPKAARQVLTCRRAGGEDDGKPSMKDALAIAARDPALGADLDAQTNFDCTLAKELDELDLPETAAELIAKSAEAIAARRGGALTKVRNPAILAVGAAFLLLIALLVWNFLGRAGTFPEEAIKIATTGAKAIPEHFDAVEAKAGELQDWFMLKGFEGYKIPPGLENFEVVGVRMFKVENESVAQAAVPENFMYFYCFPATPFGIRVIPEGSWRITEADRSVLALREEHGICFMVAFRGKKADMQRFLEKAGAK